MILGKWPTWRTNSFLCIYFIYNSPQVSSTSSGERNCINTTSGNRHCVSGKEFVRHVGHLPRNSTRCYIEVHDRYWKWTHVNRLMNENNANVLLIYLSNNNTISSLLTRPETIYEKYRLWTIVMQNLTWQIQKTIQLSSDFITVTIITLYKTFLHLCHKFHKGFCYRTIDDTVGAVSQGAEKEIHASKFGQLTVVAQNTSHFKVV
jgi:hypothetical protein